MAEGTKHFSCKDVGYDCEWKLSGTSEEEMLPKIEKHAAEVHNETKCKPQAEQHVLVAIRQNDQAGA